MRLLPLFLAVACLACPKGPVPHDLGEYQLDVQVLDAASGEPLAKALVVEMLFQRAGHTNVTGDVTLQLPYFYEGLILEASAPGFLTSQLECTTPVEGQMILGVQLFLQPISKEWSPVIEKPGLLMTLDAGWATESKVAVPAFAVPFPLQCRLTVSEASTLPMVVQGPWTSPYTAIARFQLDARPLAESFLKPWRIEIPVAEPHALSFAENGSIQLFRFDASRSEWEKMEGPVAKLENGLRVQANIDRPGNYLFVATPAEWKGPAFSEDPWIGLEIAPMAPNEGRLLPSPLPATISQEILLTPYFGSQPVVRNQLLAFGYLFDRWEDDCAVYRKTIPLPNHLEMSAQSKTWYQCGTYLEVARFDPLASPNQKAATRVLLTRYFLLTGVIAGDAETPVQE